MESFSNLLRRRVVGQLLIAKELTETLSVCNVLWMIVIEFAQIDASSLFEGIATLLITMLLQTSDLGFYVSYIFRGSVSRIGQVAKRGRDLIKTLRSIISSATSY